MLHYDSKFHYGLIFGILAVLIIPINFVYGHGLGFETISGIEIDDKEISVTVEIPMDFEKSENKQITISAIDEETGENVENILFQINLIYEDNQIINDKFFAPNGNLAIGIKSTEDAEIIINGEKNELWDAWQDTGSAQIEVSGPIFYTGGLYHFEIEIISIGEPSNTVNSSFVADINTISTTNYLEEVQVPFRMKSYFERISNFNYDAENKIVIFEMPFDWSEKVISHIPVVHEEVHFPKDYAGFLSPSYTGKVNGIDLFKSSVTIDDYSDNDERIVHFVLLQDHLKFLKEQQKKSGELPNYIQFTLESSEKVEFPMIAMTSGEEIQVDLSWEPIIIEPDVPTKFIFTFRDGSTGDTLRLSSYDFVIIQNGVQVYKTSGEATVGGAFEDFTFSESQTGPTIIKFENIRGTSLETEFGLVVVPEFGAITIMIFVAAMTSVFILTQLRFSKIRFH